MNSLTQSLSSMINEFSKITQHVSMCLGLSVIVILFFIVSPLNVFALSKILVITILGYIVCYNTHQTNKFVTKHNINMFGSEWNPIKTNVLFSYIFSASLLFLALSLFRKM